ncbi:MAG: tripartite tricarboxylate transporter substrate binding protein [Rubrivivax sp.]|nr:tripartite tricarboxylate transporter substrate binding protein [Rubrivivax sp.]MDP3082755.1 tripartite tricarboxylate transporter substrate binding protein [Rubrivivax sp.]
MTRRQWLATVALAAAAGLPLGALADEAYPARPVKVTVGFPPGSSTDVATRLVAERLGRLLGQPFVVENRPGASSSIAAKLVAGMAGDGYNLFVGTIANTINSSFPGSTTPNLSRDFVPVSMIGSVPNLLVAHPSLAVASVDELVRTLKARPGQVSYASSGNGTSPHLSGELFSSMAGVTMLHVPYRGSSPAVTDLLAGQVSLMFSPASTVLAHIRAGKLKALAATSLKRSEIAPDLPTLDELGLKGFETSVWFGLVAPAGTPAAVVARLNGAVQTVLDSAELKALFAAQGIEAVKASPDAFDRYIRSEMDKWARLIQSAGIKPE